MKQRQTLRTAVAADLPFPFFPCPGHAAPADAVPGPEQGLQGDAFAQCCGNSSSTICPARVPSPSHSSRTPNTSSPCPWEGTRLMLLPDPHPLSHQASVTTHIWRVCPAGSTARDFLLLFFSLILLQARF